MSRNRSFGFLCFVLSLGLLSACGGEEQGSPGGSGGSPEICTSSEECGGAQPHCVEGRCVACLAHAECPDTAPSCNDGTCGRCSSDAACEGRDGPRCQQDTGRCVECLVDRDCGDGSCVANSCQQAAGCTTNAECGRNQLCLFPSDTAQFGRCEEMCDPYAATGCVEGRTCSLVTFSQDGQPVGACLQPNGGAGEQQSCVNQGCEVGLICVTYGTNDQRCTSVCDPDAADTCGERFLCTEIPVETPAGASLGICLPQLFPCELDADCAQGEVCNLTLDDDGQMLTACTVAVGSRLGGERCTNDAQCASNFCLEGQGVCYGTCTRDAGCAQGSACVDVTFSSGGEVLGEAPACFPACENDAACGPSQTCSLAAARGDEGYVTVCNPAVGFGAAGTACTTGANCRSGGCSGGFCTGFCESNDDCGPLAECAPTGYFVSLGPDGGYGTEDDVWQVFHTCRGRSCDTNADCTGNRVCGLEVDRTAWNEVEAVQRCIAPIGTRRGGETCSGNADCLSGHCYDRRHVPEDCNDGIDNNGNGLIDCEDPACFEACFPPPPDCNGQPHCYEANCTTGNCCTDGIDNDGDGRVDCADPDCAWDMACREYFCADGIDNDGDGLIDCDDPDCASSSSCAQRVCFEACEVAADCAPGMSCVPGASWVLLDWVRSDYGYADACVPAR